MEPFCELTKAPFEPMKDTDLKHLTLKTAFLLSLASGKCHSEIHAWVANKVYNLDQWEKVALFPSSDFIAKNQLAREGSQSVSPVTTSIPALTTIVDRQFKENRTLCPVWALRYYLDRTKDLRGSRSLLFISFNKGHTSDIRPATLSSWLKQTILLCYIQADQQALVQVKAHDIRAFAASKDFYDGVSVDLIMQACHWKAHNTFTNFYPKDLTWSDNDNYMYLGPVVAAQQVLGPSPQTSYPLKEKKRGHICYNQVFRSLIPGSRYRFTSQDVTGEVIFSVRSLLFLVYQA